jgi:hypothetical protein
MRYTGIETIDKKIEEMIKAMGKRKYFVMRELDECNKLIPEVGRLVKDCKKALEPWYKTSWLDALFAGLSATYRAAKRKGRLDALDKALEDVWDVAENAAQGAAFRAGVHDEYVAYHATKGAGADAASYIHWVIVSDIRRKCYKNNPYERILEIWYLGLCPRGFRKVDGDERFVVDFPLRTYEFGCWAEGDPEILYKHKLDGFCTEIEPVKPVKRLRKIELPEEIWKI